jgi:hypothetical protein
MLLTEERKGSKAELSQPQPLLRSLRTSVKTIHRLEVKHE